MATTLKIRKLQKMVLGCTIRPPTLQQRTISLVLPSQNRYAKSNGDEVKPQRTGGERASRVLGFTFWGYNTVLHLPPGPMNDPPRPPPTPTLTITPMSYFDSGIR